MILTGASHTGKTSVAQALLRSASSPAAFLGVDQVLETLIRPPREIWAEISLAYELLLPQLETLLDQDWFVVLESTFTYVPPSGAPEFHATSLRRMIDVAERREVPWLLTQLSAPPEIALSRADRTGRVSSEIVASTLELHHAANLPPSALRIDGTDEVEMLAKRILAALRGLSD